MRYSLKTALCITGLVFTATNVPAQAQSLSAEPPSQTVNDDNWDFTLGAGAAYTREYEGSDNSKIVPIPIVKIEYKDGLFFADSIDGIGTYPLRSENMKLGVSLGYAPGREQDDDRENLWGMGDLDDSATVNLLASYKFGPASLSGRISSGITGDYGTTAAVKLGMHRPITDDITLLGSIGATWADDEHMYKRFGVSFGQSFASGYARYKPEAGLKSLDASLGARYSITDHWDTTFLIRGEQLMGDAQDSPIVKDDLVPTALITTSYKF